MCCPYGQVHYKGIYIGLQVEEDRFEKNSQSKFDKNRWYIIGCDSVYDETENNDILINEYTKKRPSKSEGGTYHSLTWS